MLKIYFVALAGKYRMISLVRTLVNFGKKTSHSCFFHGCPCIDSGEGFCSGSFTTPWGTKNSKGHKNLFELMKAIQICTHNFAKTTASAQIN